jgi:hypothetical protein
MIHGNSLARFPGSLWGMFLVIKGDKNLLFRVDDKFLVKGNRTGRGSERKMGTGYHW